MDVVAFLATGTLLYAIAKVRLTNASARGGKDPVTGVDRDLLGTVARYRHKYGYAIRDEFGLDWAYTHLNHGSYGTAPKRVVRAARKEMDKIEAFPDDFFRRNAVNRYIGVCENIGTMFDAPSGSVVLVENATVAVNTVLRSVAPELKPGDVILVNNHTYAACRNAVVDTATKAGATVVCATLPLPVSAPQQLIDPLVQEADRILASGRRLAFVLLDHITSPTALVLPVGAIATAIKARAPDCLVMVDGAHVPGQLEIRLGPQAGDLAAIDFYCGNLHKWAFAIKGCAFLYVTPARQAVTQGPAVSHFWKRPFQQRFYMQGTGDYSRYLSLPYALAFLRDTVGGERAMREYNSSLARAGAQFCAHAWGTETLLPPGADPSLCAPFLVPVRTPFDVRAFLTSPNAGALTHEEAAAAADADDGLNERVATAIFTHSRIQVQVVWWRSSAVPGGQGALFTRLSAQVYNTLDDYKKLAKAVQNLAAQHRPV